MPIGAIAGAAASLAGIMMQGSAQRDQRNMQILNFYEQKRQAREREKLAKATRDDAYGNKVRYIDGVGFKTEVTPLTQAILNSQQKEQLAQFREDAPRMRAAAERQDRRSKAASEVFEEKFNKYRYRDEKPESQYQAELLADALMANAGRKSSPAIKDAAITAARTGDYKTLRRTVKQATDAATDANLSAIIANARRGGTQQFLAESSARDSKDLGELQQVRAIADAVINSNLNFANENAALSQTANNALSSLIATNAQNSSLVGSAANGVANAAGQSPNLNGLAGALSKLSLPKGGKTQSADEKLLADLLLQQNIGDARIGIAKNNNILSAFKGNSGSF